MAWPRRAPHRLDGEELPLHAVLRRLHPPSAAQHILGRNGTAIIIATIATAAACKWLAATWDVSGWFRLAVAGAAVSLLYAAAGYWILFNREERASPGA